MTSAHTTAALLGCLVLVSIRADGQTFTSVMNGESSTRFSFLNGTSARTPVTTLQSPFLYPATTSGAYDTRTYRPGNSNGLPPWWFGYISALPSGLYTLQDLTDVRIYRNPSYGQISTLKQGVTGIRAKARFAGSGSGTGGFYEAIYFGERPDWAGRREFGFFRKVNEQLDGRARVYFYWSTNSNCSIRDNRGYPWCRSSQATTGSREIPGSVPLFAEHFEATEINNVDPSKQYVWVAYLFRASWDATYKFRVEMWDATHTTLIAAFNADTIAGGANFAASPAGMNGFVTLGTQRIEPVSASGPLIISSVDIAR